MELDALQLEFLIKRTAHGRFVGSKQRRMDCKTSESGNLEFFETMEFHGEVELVSTEFISELGREREGPPGTAARVSPFTRISMLPSSGRYKNDRNEQPSTMTSIGEAQSTVQKCDPLSGILEMSEGKSFAAGTVLSCLAQTREVKACACSRLF